MASRKGTLLERNVERLLKLSGFEPRLNTWIRGYEIDVFLKLGEKNIALECKQYERSSLSVRNLIHQWESKKRELELDRIILVLVGSDISSQEYQLAEKFGIIIWGEKKLEYLLDTAIDIGSQNKSNMLVELGLKEELTEEELERMRLDQEKLKRETEDYWNKVYMDMLDKFSSTQNLFISREVKAENIEKLAPKDIIKKALDNFMDKSDKDRISFNESELHAAIQYEYSTKGLFFSYSSATISKRRLPIVKGKFVEVLKYYSFKKVKFRLSEIVYSFSEYQEKLNEKEFFINESDDSFTLWIQCGKDTEFITELTDKIFRNVFDVGDNYRLMVMAY